jgi:hypothetical protein
MDSGFALWLFAVSLSASALGGMLGMVGGIFIVPILAIFGHVDIHVAASTVSVILRGDARKMKVVRALDGRKTAIWDARRQCCVRSDSL